MGTAAHAVIEAAYRGDFESADDPKRAALFVWDTAIHELAGEVPGSREPARWRNYQIRRLGAATRAAEIATAGPPLERREYAAPALRVEGWLRSADGRIVGRPDRIETRGGRVTVIDLKTGAVAPDDIPAAYRQQLLLYAWLWHEVADEWPDGAAIEMLDGTRAWQDIAPAECDAVADAAVKALASFNRLVESAADFVEVATPGIEHCRFCRFRGGCPAFLREADGEWDSQRVAVGGRVRDDSGADSPQRCLTIATECGTAAGSSEIRVRGTVAGPRLDRGSFIVADRVLAEVALHDYWADEESLIWSWDEGMAGRLRLSERDRQ